MRQTEGLTVRNTGRKTDGLSDWYSSCQLENYRQFQNENENVNENENADEVVSAYIANNNNNTHNHWNNDDDDNNNRKSKGKYKANLVYLA